jgi:hypothetical protein
LQVFSKILNTLANGSQASLSKFGISASATDKFGELCAILVSLANLTRIG